MKVGNVFVVTKNKALLGPGAVPPALRRAAAVYLNIQREKIAAGKDVLGVGFDAYKSEDYRRLKNAYGGIKGHWLRVSGGMLDSQKATVEVQSGSSGRRTYKMRISFVGDYPGKRLAENKRGKVVAKSTGRMVNAMKVAAGNQKTRTFIGISSRDVERLMRAIFSRQ